MIPQSSQYYVNVDKPIREPFHPTVLLSSSDPTLIAKTQFDSSSSELVFSKRNQLFNQIVNPSWGLQTFEPNRTIADGSFVVFDDNTAGEFGWWSEARCDENGVFETPQIIKLNYTENLNFIEFSIFFDSFGKEWSDDFEIFFYSQSGAVIQSYHITDCDSPIYLIENELNFVRSMEIRINKWSVGHRFAKISELLSGFVISFTDDEIFGISFTENLSLFQEEIISSELLITVENFNQQFNINNPQGVAKKLNLRQVFTAAISLEHESIPLGLMYLMEQQNNDRNFITFVCRSVFDFSEDEYIPESWETCSAYSLFEKLFQKIGINEYDIPESLKNIQVNQYVEKMSIRQAIQQLANSVRCVVYVNRTGSVTVDTINSLFSHTGQSITLNQNTTEEPPRVEKLKTNDSATVNIYQYSKDDEIGNTELVKDFKVLVDSPTPVSYIISYKTIADSVTAEVTGASVSGNILYYADRCEIMLFGQGEAVVNISGTPVLQKIGKVNIKSDLFYLNPIKEDYLIENQFIASTSEGRILASAFVEFSQFRLRHEVYERGRPDLEVGDMINVENEFGLLTNGIIFEQNIEFNQNGFLEGKMIIKAKGEN
jgi:hypothetical protein